MRDVEPRMDPITNVGEHMRSILRMLGYGDEHIDRLLGEGAM
jgi:crotonobetainyl-CoA:carnitine CoA-transferase CaiB-like acyl-CoA transferase